MNLAVAPVQNLGAHAVKLARFSIRGSWIDSRARSLIVCKAATNIVHQQRVVCPCFFNFAVIAKSLELLCGLPVGITVSWLAPDMVTQLFNLFQSVLPKQKYSLFKSH
jgi:hypothetical protein